MGHLSGNVCVYIYVYIIFTGSMKWFTGLQEMWEGVFREALQSCQEYGASWECGEQPGG